MGIRLPRQRKEVVVDHQEVIGSLVCKSWSHPVLIVAEGWPSMSFAAQAVGYLDVTTWCKFEYAKSKVEYMSTRLGSTLTEMSLEKLAVCFASQPAVTVLIQGQAEFSNHFRGWADRELRNAKTLEVIPDTDLDRWDGTFLWKGNLSHQDLGGVTRNRY